MPSLSNHQSNDYVKLLLLGDSKSGKTSSLVSLVAAGYKLRILDFDNLLDFFKRQVERICPDKIDNVEFFTLRDEYEAGGGDIKIADKASAWPTAVKMCDRWKYKDGATEVDLGTPYTWGSDCILVVDSLSRLCDAAYDYHEMVIPRGKNSGEYDGRAVYGNAQDAVEKFIAMLTAKSMMTNVIVICHGTYIDLPDKTTKIFPQGVGQKLSPKIPQYFPNFIRYKNINNRREIQLVSDSMIDLAVTNPEAFISVVTGDDKKQKRVMKTLQVETGLAEFFEALRKPKEKPQPTSKPTSLKLQRV